MKKLITALLTVTLIFTLAACTNSGGGNNGTNNGGTNNGGTNNGGTNNGGTNNENSTLSEDNMLGSSTPLATDGSQNNSSQAKLSYDEAKAAALNHAGLNADDVKFLRSELDRDDGRLKYEVEFTKDGVEYEYDIDANTGDILWVDKDYD